MVLKKIILKSIVHFFLPFGTNFTVVEKVMLMHTQAIPAFWASFNLYINGNKHTFFVQSRGVDSQSWKDHIKVQAYPNCIFRNQCTLPASKICFYSIHSNDFTYISDHRVSRYKNYNLFLSWLPPWPFPISTQSTSAQQALLCRQQVFLTMSIHSFFFFLVVVVVKNKELIQYAKKSYMWKKQYS